jgi:hypothetical protein
MNPYLSNTMPELTEDEFKSLGSYTVSYWDEAVNSYVATRNGSWYLFFKHAGISNPEEQKIAKELAYNVGHLTILNTTTGREAEIYV